VAESRVVAPGSPTCHATVADSDSAGSARSVSNELIVKIAIPVSGSVSARL